jgi:enamine deaminase RidA (YjgF/YER057c/UK114 family)
MTRKFVNPPGLKPLGMYTQVTAAHGGSIAFVSGQVSVDSSGKVVGAGNIEAQAVQVFENIKAALTAIGASFENVIKLNIYIVGFSQERRKAVMDVRARYISQGNPPAATMVGVDQLVEPELLVEVEAVAAID